MPRRAAGTPILPILTYLDLSEVVNLIKRRARSLAGYIFSRDRATIEYFVHSLSFGGGCREPDELAMFHNVLDAHSAASDLRASVATTANTDYSTP